MFPFENNMVSKRRKLFDLFQAAQTALFALERKMPADKQVEIYRIRLALAGIENIEIHKDERAQLIQFPNKQGDQS